MKADFWYFLRKAAGLYLIIEKTCLSLVGLG